MAQASRTVKKTGRKMQRVGKRMSAAVTAPMLAAGAGAVKMAGDFEQSFSRMEGLVGVGEKQIAQFREEIQAMSGEVGKGPRELAEAMFFITSAGLEGEQALRALRASAKAASAGLGDTKTVADAATSAMNAYGQETLSAEEATDTLVATVREGKVEPAQLAGSLGKVIPVASKLGVSFDQVGASMASLTRLGLNARKSTTALRSVLTTLQKPSKEAQETLQQFGLSAAGLRKKVREDGLLNVLLMLRDRFGDNEEAMAKVFGNVRALTGALSLVGKNADKAQQIFNSLRSSTGATDRAFQEAKSTFNFRFQQLTAGAERLAITLGNSLLPIANRVVSWARSLVQSWQSLSSRTRAQVKAFAAVAAAIGPVLFVGGKLITVFSALKTAVIGVTGALFSVKGVVAITVAALAGGAFLVVKHWKSVSSFFQGMWANLKTMFSAGVDILVTPFQISWQKIKEVTFSAIREMLGAVRSLLQSLPDKVVPDGWVQSLEGAENAMDGFASGSEDRMADLKKELTGAQSKMAKAFSQSWDDITGAATGSMDTIESEFGAMVSTMESWWSDFVSTFEGGQASPQGAAPGQSQSASDGERAGNSAGAHQVFNVGKMRRVTKQVNKMAKGFENTKQKGTATKMMWRDMTTAARVSINTTQQLFGSLFSSFTRFGDEMISVKQRFKQFGTSALRILSRVVSKIASAVATAAALKGIMSIFSMGSIGGASTFGGLFSSLLGLQHGGLVMGPTLAMVGEGPRTGPSNPEVVAPLDKLKSMIVGAGSFGGQVSNGGGGAVRARYTSRGILIEHENVDASQAEGERRRGRRGRTRP